jgi:uncharacterized protein YkwD
MNFKLQEKISLCLFLTFLSAPITGFAQPNKVDEADYLSSSEKSVVREINIARTAPKRYASSLEKWRAYYDAKLLKLPGEVPIQTKEGVGAVVEAIRYLRSQNPVPLLSPSKGMSLGARDHVKDQGSSGSSEHQGRDGSQPWDRANRYGTWQKTIGENISLGHDKSEPIAMSFIVDDGVPSRGHRKNIFNPDFCVIGVACGPHATYGTICVITFAGGYHEKN